MFDQLPGLFVHNLQLQKSPADAAGQATFHCGFHEVGGERGKRDGHVDLPNAALLASAKLSNRGYATGDNIIEPPAT